MKAGRPRLLDDLHKTELLNWYANGGRDFKVKAALLGVSGATLRRQIQRWQNSTAQQQEAIA